jgi:lysophospholipase L1-like esterase
MNKRTRQNHHVSITTALATLLLACGAIMFTHAATAATVVAWGDSLTYGTGADHPGDGEKHYRKWFAEFSGATVINQGVGGETSGQIRTRLIAETATGLRNEFIIIWAGNNNPDATDKWVQRHIAEMVAALPHQDYLIVGVINRSTAPAGSATWNNINIINADLKTTWGIHFVDIRPLLVSSWNQNVAQDVIDYGNDVIPSSLRALLPSGDPDAIHLNTEGYRIVAQAIYNSYLTLTMIPEPAAAPRTLALGGLVISTFLLARAKRNKPAPDS